MLSLPNAIDTGIFQFMDLNTALVFRSCSKRFQSRYGFKNKLLWQNLPSTLEYIYRCPSANQVNVLMDLFLPRAGAISVGNVSELICLNGHLDVAQLLTAQWLVSEFKLAAEEIKTSCSGIIRITCERGHTELLQWLVSEFKLE